MRYEAIIIGGGLGGLVSGIRLAQAGRRVAIISAGKSALHFCSGSLELWSKGREELLGLSDSHPSHPYNIVGLERLARYTKEVKEMFRRAGMSLEGDFEKPHYRLTPIGGLKPAWLTLEEYVTFCAKSDLEGRRVLIVGLDGYLDFYPEFIASGLGRLGAECRVEKVSLPELERLRESAAEMRAVGIARQMQGEVLERLAEKVSGLARGCDLVLLPAVFGLADEECFKRFARMIEPAEVRVAPTVSASVPGVRAQRLLSEEFVRLGGQLIQGDRVVSYQLDRSGRIESLSTINHADILFRADDFILATGSFFGRGLVATSENIVEPIFGLDVVAAEAREEWCGEKILGEQPFQRFGVRVDGRLHPLKGGRPVENLYAVGSVLAGADAVKEGCGAGVVISTALMAADEILEQNGKRKEESL